MLGEGGDDVVIATTNVGHLSCFVPAQEWEHTDSTQVCTRWRTSD